MPREKAKKTLEDSLKLLKKKEKDMKNLPKGLQKDTTTSAYGDAGRGRPVPKFIDPVIPKKPKPRKSNRRLPPKEDNYGQFSKGGEVCRGAGAAIKGTNFKGVF